MKLDVETLGTFYEMAREGAGLAAERLRSMTELQTRVSHTRLHFTNPTQVRNELGDGRTKVGITVELEGELAGRALVLFDEESARAVTETLVADLTDEPSDEFGQSAITEICHIMNSGFVDGWADVLGAEITVSAPTFVAGNSTAAFLPEGAFEDADDELALLFRSEMETVGTEFAFEHYLIPNQDSMAGLFERRQTERGIEYEKLVGFDRMAERGAARIAENLARMTGIEMAVDIQRINFISLDAIPEAVANEALVSVAFSFQGMPSGYLVFLYDPASARELIEATVEGFELTDAGGGATDASGDSTDADGDGEDTDDETGEHGASNDGRVFGAFERDAIMELSNVMTSGLLDGWANMLETTIDHSTPAYTYDMGAAVIDPLIVGLSSTQEFAFVFDTRITAVDREFDVDIYAIPDEDDLEHALSSLDATRADEPVGSPTFTAAGIDPDLVEELGVEDIGAGELGVEEMGAGEVDGLGALGFERPEER